MSFDIELRKEDGSVCEVDLHTEGGTYNSGGTNSAQLNVTYNYSWFYYQVLDKEKGFQWLYGKKASETIDRINDAIFELGTRRYSDYWAPTPGNAGYALSILFLWTKKHPDAFWSGN